MAQLRLEPILITRDSPIGGPSRHARVLGRPAGAPPTYLSNDSRIVGGTLQPAFHIWEHEPGHPVHSIGVETTVAAAFQLLP